MKEKTAASALPLYGAAAIWPIYALLFPLYQPVHFAAAAVLSLGAGLMTASLCRRPQPNPAAAQTKAAPAEKKEGSSGSPELDKMLADGARALSEMRRLNDNIQDEKISAAIDQLENISGKIFAHVKEHPEKLPQIRRFMDYYLPTTLKILNTYDRMGSQGVAGENISGTMEKVEQLLDTIVTAFARQLDSLFGADALDISTDITVLENMLAREGLAGERLETGGGDIKLEL